eukprot:SAG31_NODE_20535_length_572_cov_0.589852_2_plen_33_part_01
MYRLCEAGNDGGSVDNRIEDRACTSIDAHCDDT